MKQRKRLEESLGGTPVRTAVVSDSVKVRFVASTIALFHKDHRSFSTGELREAYDHLSMTPSERAQSAVAIQELRKTLAESNR